MATPLGSAPLDGDRNRAFELLTVSWLFFSISTVLVIGRMYSRVVVKRNVWWDDWIICVTLASHTRPFFPYDDNDSE